MVRCRPFRWLWGLLPLALIAFLMIFGTRESIERDLRERAQSALGEARLSWAVPDFDGRDGVISGTAVNEEEQASATRLVQNLWGVRKIDDKAKLSDKISPYVWQISRKRNRIRLKGHVPSEEDRKLVLGMVHANFPGDEIDDRLKLGRGAPARDMWLGGIGFILKQLGSLSRGIVMMEDEKITITGFAEDMNGYERVKSALGNGLPTGIKIARANILPPLAIPYLWSAKLEKSGLALDGNIPSEEIKLEINNLAREIFSGIPVADRTQLASGNPQNLDSTIRFSLPFLSRLEAGTIMISDESFKFTGVASDEKKAEELTRQLKSRISKPFNADINISYRAPPKPALPVISPYLFSGHLSNGVLRLTGYVPNERARVTVLEILKVTSPETRIVDELQLGLGDIGESDWLEGIRFSLLQLSNLKFGLLQIKNGEISIIGEAETVPKLLSVQSSLKLSVPAGFVIRHSSIDPPRAVPYVFGGKFEGDTLIITGSVPSRDLRNHLLKFAAKRFPGVTIADHSTLASGTPERWLSAARIGLAQLSHLSQGELTISDTEVIVRGTTDNGYVKSRLERMSSTRFPENFNSSVSVTVSEPSPPPVKIVEADVCQELLDSELSQGSLQFKTASSELLAFSIPVLTKLAQIAKRCPATSIIIEGYTDSDGSREFNKFLSQRRAESVVRFLENAGIPEHRLSATGYGEEFPRVPNDSEENKAKNRRIEFKVRG